MKKVLVTGGCGFIGHHIIEHLIKNTDWDVKVVDKLTYASNGFDRLRDINVFDDKRVQVYTNDFSEKFSEGMERELINIDYILHVGAETHVDKSIENPAPFVKSNVEGTMHMLDFARKQNNLERFVYFSTDEVFGPAYGKTLFKEGDRHNPGNPYAASKSGAEALCISYANTYKMPIIITNTMNAFGERQNPEKYIPKTIIDVLKGEKVIVHSDPTKTIAGSRFYIHCRNIADALLFILNKPNETLDIHDATKGKFNIVGEKEVDNLELAKFIAKTLGKELKYEMVDFHSSRPGHDLRYGLDGSKLRAMGFEYPKTFEQSLEKTIKWYLENPKWLGLSQKSL